MIAQTMVEEIALPIHAMFSSDILLPVFYHGLHSRLEWERENGVQMIRHEQAKTAMPNQFFVVVFHRRERGIASACPAQLVFPRRHTINGDEEPTALGHPLWNCVRQPFTDR